MNDIYLFEYCFLILKSAFSFLGSKDDKPLSRKRRNIFLISQPAPAAPVADRRDDPYGSIRHYPELHMDIHELEHHEIDSEHEGHFGSCGYGGGYGWCPGDIGKFI